MAFVKLEVARGSGRPAADVRVMVSDVRSARQVGIIMARGVMDSMGVDLGAELDLHVGQGEDAGWLRLETASGRNGRKVGKLPQTQSGLAKFPVVAPLDLPEARSTDVDEWRVEPGALTLRLPAAMRGGVPDRPPAAPPIARTAPAPAPPAPPSLLATAGDAIRARSAAQPATTRAAYRTDARNAVMLRAWLDPALTRKQILLELQALPGPQIPTGEPALYDWAAHLGLPSQRSSQPGFIAAADRAVQQPVPTPDPAPDLADAAIAKKTAKAREMLGQGSEPGVVATHCTLPLREVFRLQAEVREAKRAGAAA